MNENILEVLKELRALRNSGELDEDEAEIGAEPALWKNKLEYGVLTDCLIHHSEEVRLVALALIVETKKTTECFTKFDLRSIMLFLKYNIGERMEYVPSVKKALKRIKESLAVLRRNVAKAKRIAECESRVDTKRELYEELCDESSKLARKSRVMAHAYKEFYREFRKLCVDSLRPGSTNARKKSSLLMLQLGQELLDGEFDDLPWCAEDTEKLFQCLLLDTYETNKEIIFKIAQRLDPRLFGLDKADRVREVIDVALDLANCIRPIDSITGAYMLKLALLSPAINKALENYPDTQNVATATLGLIVIIIERLREPLRLAEENIVAATGKHSLYGHLFCVRSLLGVCDLGKVTHEDHEAWRRTIGEIIEMSFRLNNSVLQIVNNSSPEGHFPMDTESGGVSSSGMSDNDTMIVTPQMVLVCSWRTVKEVSLLFGYLSSKLPIIDNEARVGFISEKQLSNIGEHLVALLFETKHRGAFEQAHVGFGQLCNRLWRSSRDNLKKLPKIWLHHLLLAVSGLSPGNAKLCATRRSAGVPFMVQALVSSDPFVQNNSAQAVFHSVMKILLGFTDLEEGPERIEKTRSLMYAETIFSDLQEAETKNDEDTSSARTNHETITEIKTHALNILRALFKHAQLGDLSRNYAAEGLIAAIRSYDGKTWAERNAATLLFSSLITRIFGVQRTKDHENLTLHNKMTGRIFFERYPDLLPFVLEELGAFVESSDTPIKPSVQSILLLLSRLYPSFNSDEADCKWNIAEFINLVSSCAKSTVYKTRELAARALVPLLTEKTVKSFIVELFHKLSKDRSTGSSLNAHHGYMLQILEIIKSPRSRIEELPLERVRSFLSSTDWIIENLENDNGRSACFPLATVYITALSELVERGISSDEFDAKLLWVLIHLHCPERLKERPGREIYESASARFFVVTVKHRIADAANFKKLASRFELFTPWYSIVRHENIHVNIACWSAVWRIIDESGDRDILDATLNVGTAVMSDNIEQNVDPELLDAVYDFYDSVIVKSSHDNAFMRINRVPKLVAAIIAIFTRQFEINRFHKSPSSMRLLARSFEISPCKLSEIYDVDFYMRSVYKTLVDNSWMGSSSTECRLAIASVSSDLYDDRVYKSLDVCPYLNWWTCLLNLLVNDSSRVRKQASRVFYELKVASEVYCLHQTLEIFFHRFFFDTGVWRSTIFVALIAWSTTLSGDADYEMEENDVFNKCYNYEIFDPLLITELCAKKLEELSEFSTMDDIISDNLKEWISERFGDSIDVTKFSDCRGFLDEYGKTISRIDPQLRNIIDPMYNDKLLRLTTYEKLVKATTREKKPKISSKREKRNA